MPSSPSLSGAGSRPVSLSWSLWPPLLSVPGPCRLRACDFFNSEGPAFHGEHQAGSPGSWKDLPALPLHPSPCGEKPTGLPVRSANSKLIPGVPPTQLDDMRHVHSPLFLQWSHEDNSATPHLSYRQAMPGTLQTCIYMHTYLHLCICICIYFTYPEP